MCIYIYNVPTSHGLRINFSVQVFLLSAHFALAMAGPRPYIRRMLQHGMPRCLVLILAMLAYMNNVVTWLQRELIRGQPKPVMTSHAWNGARFGLKLLH